MSFKKANRRTYKARRALPKINYNKALSDNRAESLARIFPAKRFEYCVDIFRQVFRNLAYYILSEINVVLRILMVFYKLIDNK